MGSEVPTLADVRAAAARIAGDVHRTPVWTCRSLDELAGRRLFFKCENLQRAGAFKIRGALNFVRQLPEEVARRGVVTHSSGNHGQAVALAARLRGIPARVVVPADAAAVKKAAIRAYGAELSECRPTLEAREEAARELLEGGGGTFVPPYDHPWIVAGQGTATLELLEEVPDLDAVVAPVGGGGLAAGACTVARELATGTRVYGAEPRGADDAARSLAAGRRLPQTDPRTVADGLLTGLGELPWEILRDGAAGIATVSEEEIVAALRLVLLRMKLVVEPSAAVAVAAVLTEGFRSQPGLGRVGVLLSGGNVDPHRLAALLG